MSVDEISPELLDKLSDKFYRLNNLYYIVDKEGDDVPFIMNDSQCHFFENRHNKNIILKARQMGFSTLMCILFLDEVLFMPNKKAVIIAHSLDDAQSLLLTKVKYPYHRAMEEFPGLFEGISITKETTTEMHFSNGSMIAVDTTVRGGTVQYLHVSEFGKICATAIHKAKEIVAGAFNAIATGGFLTVESTAEGNSGFFYDYTMDARAIQDSKRKLTAMDFKLFFFPWFEDYRYRLTDEETDSIEIPQEVTEYFYRLLKLSGIRVDKNQRAWYAMKHREQGFLMKQEFPSTIEEAFEQSTEGAYYQAEMYNIRQAGRITSVPFTPGLPVHTVWDVGVSDYTVIIFWQKIGQEVRIIDCIYGCGEGLPYYSSILDNKRAQLKYVYGRHVGPWDIVKKDFGTGKTLKQTAAQYGIKFELAPDLGVLDGIQATKDLLPRCYFDHRKTATSPERGGKNLVMALESYRRSWDEKGGRWKDKPSHTWESNFADALRYLAVAVDMDSGGVQAKKISRRKFGNV